MMSSKTTSPPDSFQSRHEYSTTLLGAPVLSPVMKSAMLTGMADEQSRLWRVGIGRALPSAFSGRDAGLAEEELLREVGPYPFELSRRKSWDIVFNELSQILSPLYPS